MAEVIIPPPKVAQMIEKTIPKVIQYGDAIIKGLLDKGNQNFHFLKEDHPFHPYFLLQLEKARNANDDQKKMSFISAPQTAQHVPESRIVQRPVISPSFTYKPPPDIGGLQLDVIHLTAQYAALYGQPFLRTLITEDNGPLFNFLNPSEQYFTLFQTLIDQYKLALDPSQLLQKRLNQESESLQEVHLNLIEEAKHYKKEAERKKKEAEENKASEEDRLFDFSNFKVVAVVDYDDDRVQFTETRPAHDQIVKTKRAPKQGITQISPATGQAVPVEQFARHLKMEAEHPQFIKERETMKVRREQAYNSLAPGSQMVEMLREHASGTAPAKDGPQMPIWDGREETVGKVVAQTVRVLSEQPQARPDLKKKPKSNIGPNPEYFRPEK